MDYFEISRLEMSPFIDFDKDGDEIIEPRWYCYTYGDKDGVYEGKLALIPDKFPPGTIISIKIPICPNCESNVEVCVCDFNWEKWTVNKYI